MVGSRLKKLVLLLLFFTIIVGLFLFQYLQPSSESSHTSPKLITSALPSQIHIYNLEQAKPLIELLYNESYNAEDNAFLTTLLDFIKVQPQPEEAYAELAIGLTDLANPQQGIIALNNTPYNQNWISSYLDNYSELGIPPKLQEYQGHSMSIYPLKGGAFNTLLELEGVVVLSNSLSCIEQLLCQSPNSQRTKLSALDKVRDDFFAIIQSEGYNGEISSYGFSVDSRGYHIVHSLRDTITNHLKLGTELDSSLMSLTPTMSPIGTFATYHYTPNQVKHQVKKTPSTLLSKNEVEWNLISESLLKEEINQGIIAYRVQDSVVSSSLILELVTSSNFKNNLAQFSAENKRLIRSLLREETPYIHPRISALPAPYWLNELTQTSRDLRIIYLLPRDNQLLISWDYVQLVNYNKQIQNSDEGVSRENSFTTKLNHPQNSFFIGEIGQLLIDSITNYPLLEQLTPTQQEHLRDYTLTEEHLYKEGSIFSLINLLKSSKIDINL